MADRYIINYLGCTYAYRKASMFGHTVNTGPDGYLVCRRDTKYYTSLIQAIKVLDSEIERLKEYHKYSHGTFIISKKINNRYIPGRIKIDMNGNPTWEPLVLYGTRYIWHRIDSKRIRFELFTDKGKCADYISQDTIYKIEPTFYEMGSGLHIPEYMAEQILKQFVESSLSHKIGLLSQSKQSI